MNDIIRRNVEERTLRERPVLDTLWCESNPSGFPSVVRMRNQEKPRNNSKVPMSFSR